MRMYGSSRSSVSYHSFLSSSFLKSQCPPFGLSACMSALTPGLRPKWHESATWHGGGHSSRTSTAPSCKPRWVISSSSSAE
eukprot:3911294-Pyramimonas_sp.AAC.1